MALIVQEVSTEREIEIPEPVREIYKLWRPTPLYPRAPPGEGARYAGAHLLQVRGRQPGRQPQAQHRRAAGLLQQAKPASSSSRPRPAPASGARRWPSPAQLFGIEVKVYMVKVSYDQKPYRRALMETYGATLRRQPQRRDQLRPRRSWPRTPTSPAASASPSREAVEVAANAPTPSTRSAACSTTCCCTRR